MRKFLGLVFLAFVVLAATTGSAFANPYPATLDNGNLVLVDGSQGVGRYADRSSVVVQQYAPPNYQIAINVVTVFFSDDYWSRNRTYVGGPYRIESSRTLFFRYNWTRKSISYERSGRWLDWDVNRDHSHADGDPLIPYTAEVAFVSSYNMRFFGSKMGYSPVLRKEMRVIDESLYRSLGL